MQGVSDKKCLQEPPSPSLCCPMSYKELNSFHFAFHLQLPRKFSRVFAVQLRSEQGMPRGSAGIWAYLLICHCEHTSFRAAFKTKPASNSQHNTFSSALQKHLPWQRIPKQFVYLKGDIQVGFRRNDSEDDWKKLKEYLKTPAWGSPLTSKRRKLKPCKRRKIRHFVHTYVFGGGLGGRAAWNSVSVIITTFAVVQCSGYFSWTEAAVELFTPREDCKISSPKIPT